jgi:hypothetical protein
MCGRTSCTRPAVLLVWLVKPVRAVVTNKTLARPDLPVPKARTAPKANPEPMVKRERADNPARAPATLARKPAKDATNARPDPRVTPDRPDPPADPVPREAPATRVPTAKEAPVRPAPPETPDQPDPTVNPEPRETTVPTSKAEAREPPAVPDPKETTERPDLTATPAPLVNPARKVPPDLPDPPATLETEPAKDPPARPDPPDRPDPMPSTVLAPAGPGRKDYEHLRIITGHGYHRDWLHSSNSLVDFKCFFVLCFLLPHLVREKK